MAQVGKKLIVGKEKAARPPSKVFDVTGKNSKGRSKSKIPKTVRYDLENALVNLCDVWFDEIKPHLIRNKIKLHVHEDDAGEEERKKLPQRVPECSHLDPGDSDLRQRQDANSAVCSSTQRTASRAHWRRPPQGPLLPPCQRLSASPMTQQQKHSGNDYTKRRTRRRRKVRTHTQSETRLQIPRLCNNFDSGLKSNQVHPKTTRCQKKPSNVKNNKTKLKDKYTQTQYNWLSSRDSTTMPKSPKILQRPKAPRKQFAINKKPIESPLFNADIIEIICSNHNDNLEVLYKSPTRSEDSSVMNLISVSNKKLAKKKKIKPWR